MGLEGFDCFRVFDLEPDWFEGPSQGGRGAKLVSRALTGGNWSQAGFRSFDLESSWLGRSGLRETGLKAFDLRGSYWEELELHWFED